MGGIRNGAVGRIVQRSAVRTGNSYGIESVPIPIRLIGDPIAPEKLMNHVLAISIALAAVS